jgi:hydrogenase maturation protein HypF
MASSAARRLRVEIQGAVQGVGFRPFVYRLATELGLAGWVINDTQGVFVEVEGADGALQRFLERVSSERPPRAIVQSLRSVWLPPQGYSAFEIRHSDSRGAKTVLVLPDIATCPDCLAEVFDPGDRRFRYPFTNCTNCGPRFTIIEALPYDRPNTSMRRFTMCPACQTEYENPLDRRFHAQPNACPQCGPQLALYDSAPGAGRGAVGDDAVLGAAQALRAGRILALKGLGGFQLMVDARNAAAVTRLRERKLRRDKPFALMARDLAQARTLCEIPPLAEELLASAEAPIVLLRRLAGSQVAAEVAPGNPYLGLMLPYTPLHHLLMRELDCPLVATSGNLSDEPICIDNAEAMERLQGIADLYLVHDRPIVRHADDSLAWVLLDEARLLRRARGYAPLPVLLAQPIPSVLAVGAHLKNTVALSVERQVFISQHIGDLETPEAMSAFQRVIGDFLKLYEATPRAIAHDLHPDYLSTRWARTEAQTLAAEWGANRSQPHAASAEIELIPVQHHHAHLAACLAENAASGPALGIIWDGTGYGTDGSIWGGEFLLGDAAGFERVGHLRPFRLPGGEAAIHEPARTALALLWEMYGEAGLAQADLAPVGAYTAAERRLFGQMLGRGVNAPLTTSAGRLFDGVAALVGLHQCVNFEGQAAMALEFAIDPAAEDAYPLELLAGDGLILDWRPLLEALLGDLRRSVPAGIMAARFHNALVEGAVSVAQRVGQARVVLSGGCFQNRYLTEHLARRLQVAGFEVLLHRQVPPNDGCISLGQVAVAAARLKKGD